MITTDALADTPGTLLQAHLSDDGDAWANAAEATGDINIFGGTEAACSVPGGTVARAILAFDPATPDYSVEATIHNVSATDDNYPALWGRAEAAAVTGYQVYWYVFGDQLILRRSVAGVNTDVATAALDGSTSSAVVKLSMVGALVRVYVDGVLSMSFDDPTPIVATGRAGLSFYTAASHSTQRIHHLTIEELAAALPHAVLAAITDDED
jgi:hypothetical protein